jgi:hypothetical protein
MPHEALHDRLRRTSSWWCIHGARDIERQRRFGPPSRTLRSARLSDVGKAQQRWRPSRVRGPDADRRSAARAAASVNSSPAARATDCARRLSDLAASPSAAGVRDETARYRIWVSSGCLGPSTGDASFSTQRQQSLVARVEEGSAERWAWVSENAVRSRPSRASRGTSAIPRHEPVAPPRRDLLLEAVGTQTMRGDVLAAPHP